MEVIDENIIKLKRVLSLMDEESMTNEDFLAAFQKVVDLIKKLHTDNATEFDGVHRAVQVLGDKLKSDTSKEFSLHKKEAQLFIASEFTKIITNANTAADAKIAALKKQVDNLPQVDEQALLSKFLSEVPKVDPQKLYTAEEVRNMLESLTDENRLDASFIKNLPKTDSSVKGVLTASALYSLADVNVAGITPGQSILWNGLQWIAYTPASGGGSGYQQPTSGTVNGVNQVFVFATAPNVLSVDGGRNIQKVSSDGTINWTGTTTVTLSVAPNFDVFAVG